LGRVRRSRLGNSGCADALSARQKQTTSALENQATRETELLIDVPVDAAITRWTVFDEQTRVVSRERQGADLTSVFATTSREILTATWA
jgi:hypothetical protein